MSKMILIQTDAIKMAENVTKQLAAKISNW